MTFHDLIKVATVYSRDGPGRPIFSNIHPIAGKSRWQNSPTLQESNSTTFRAVSPVSSSAKTSLTCLIRSHVRHNTSLATSPVWGGEHGVQIWAGSGSITNLKPAIVPTSKIVAQSISVTLGRGEHWFSSLLTEVVLVELEPSITLLKRFPTTAHLGKLNRETTENQKNDEERRDTSTLCIHCVMDSIGGLFCTMVKYILQLLDFTWLIFIYLTYYLPNHHKTTPHLTPSILV